MGIDVRRLDERERERERWDELIERSPHATPFHRFGALEEMAHHSGSDLIPLIGYKGQEPVGLFPCFEISRGPVSTVFSPPPDLKITYLGPVLVNNLKVKQRKAERRHRGFIDGCLEELDRELSPRYVHVRTAPQYSDARPFLWNDFEASPAYTYHVDLTSGKDALLDRFSSDARRNIREVEDADCAVEERDEEAVRAIISQVKQRHEAQGEPYALTPEFVTDLYEHTQPGIVRPYTCTVEGAFAGGMVALELGDVIYRWQGGVRPDSDLPINDFLDWSIMTEAIERGLEVYDLVGAITPRLCAYKAKFGPRVCTHQNLQRSTKGMELAAGLYKRLR